MPIPKPIEKQTQDEFMSVCMGNDIMNKEYPDQKQRAAICMTSWKNKDKKEMTDEKMIKEFKATERKVYDINDVEIFSVGKWNDEKFTENDLDNLVKSFDELGTELKPYVKLGHDDKQKLLQKDGYPSIGWITKLKRNGEKLLADISGMPKKIYELVQSKAYGRWSPEIYFNLQNKDKKYPRVLKALSLLGGDTPACTNLDDYINLYEAESYEDVKTYMVNDNNIISEKVIMLDNRQEDNMEEIKKLQEELKAKEEQFSLKEKELQTKIEDLKKYKDEINKLEKEKHENEVKLFINNAVKEGKISPAQVNYFTSFALSESLEISESGLKIYSFVDNNETKKIEFKNNFELVKQMIDNSPKMFEFNEKTENMQPDKGLNDDEKLNSKIENYAKEHKMNYSEAYKIITKEMKEGGK